MTVFISYSFTQLDAAVAVAEYLESNGIRVWYASRDSRGSAFPDAIPKAIKRASAVVLLFSARADSSPDIMREMLLADEDDKTLLVVNLEDTKPDRLRYFLSTGQTPFDFTSREESALADLLNELRFLGCERQYGPIGLASSDTIRIMDGLGSEFSAVDDSILLIGSAEQMHDFNATVTLDPNQDYQGVRPTREILADQIANRKWDSDAVSRLRSALPVERADEISQWKLGVTRIIRGAPAQHQPPTAILGPQLWWLESNFNRRLIGAKWRASESADPADVDLVGIGDRLGRGLLENLGAGIYEFDFPSSLYVEVAVIDADNELLVLAKDQRAGSDESQAGRRWTCSIEESARVSDIVDGHVDLKTLAINGIQRELSVPPAQVAEIALYGVALNLRNLNTAVVGVAVLRDISVREIRARVQQAKLHDFRDGHAVPLREAIRLIEDPPPHMASGSWHATARLRLLLALTHAGLSPNVSDIY